MIVRLSFTRIIVSKLSALVIECGNQINNKSSHAVNMQLVLDIPCGREVGSSHFRTPNIVRTCNNSDPTEFSNYRFHAINLLRLSYFSEEVEPENLVENSIFRSKSSISLSTLAIESPWQPFKQNSVSERSCFQMNSLMLNAA